MVLAMPNEFSLWPDNLQCKGLAQEYGALLPGLGDRVASLLVASALLQEFVPYRTSPYQPMLLRPLLEWHL